MDTPKLKKEWTNLDLVTQRQQWQNVAGLSEQISNAALKADWQTVLPLAEERQHKLDEFFREPICPPLFQTIADQLAAIQQQHEVVARQVKLAIEANEAKSQSLQQTRDTLNQQIGH